MASGVLQLSEESLPIPAVTPSNRVMVEQLTPRVASRTAVSPGVIMFKPAFESAAPIVRLGSLVGSHNPECAFAADLNRLQLLCTPRHSCRPMCTCLSNDDLDVAFAVELHERDLVIDAFYVVRSLLARKPQLENADLNHILYKFECVLHLYRLLAVVDVAGSSMFLKNLLADDVQRHTVVMHDEGHVPFNGDPFMALTPRKASYQRSRLSTAGGSKSVIRSAIIPFLDRRRSSISVADGDLVVGASPSHAINAIVNYRIAAAAVHSDDNQDLRKSSIRESKSVPAYRALSRTYRANKKPKKRQYIKPLEDLSEVGIRALPGAEDMPILEYLTECCLKATFERAPLARMSSSVTGKDPIPSSLDPHKWNCLENDDLECRIWLHHIPNSTAILLRLEGMVCSPLVDILSVMAEVEHAKKWVPYMTSPVRMGLAECKCICRSGRFDKTTSYLFALPWPLKDRLAVVQGWLVDDIQRNGSFTFSYRAFTPEDEAPDFSPLPHLVVPPGSVPVEFEGGAVLTSVTEDKSFVRMVSLIDPKEKLPAVVINFFAARFMKMAWNAFRKVCMNAGSNEVLQAARNSDPWLYDYIKERQQDLYR